MKIVEVILAVAILALALVVFYRSLRTKAQGSCTNCDGCAAKCPSRETGDATAPIVFLPKKG